MFREAENVTAGHQADLFTQLEKAVDGLEKTATTWYDETSDSVKVRRTALFEASGLAERVSAMLDAEESADLHVLSETLRYQANELAEVQQDLSVREYNERVGSTNSVQFLAPFTGPLADESHTASRTNTDWDLFMAIEPRQFVAANTCESNEMRIRAFAFMDDATSGHGLSRSAKQNLAAEFISRVADIRPSVKETKTASKVAEVSFDDSALFF